MDETTGLMDGILKAGMLGGVQGLFCTVAMFIVGAITARHQNNLSQDRETLLAVITAMRAAASDEDRDRLLSLSVQVVAWTDKEIRAYRDLNTTPEKYIAKWLTKTEKT